MKVTCTKRLAHDETRSNPLGSRGSTMVNRTLAEVSRTMTSPRAKRRLLTGRLRWSRQPEGPAGGSAAARRGPASAPWYDQWISGAASGHVGGVDGLESVPGIGLRSGAPMAPWVAGAGRCRHGPVRARIPAASPAPVPSRERAKEDESTVNDVVDRPEESRFEVTVDGQTAELVYRLGGTDWS